MIIKVSMKSFFFACCAAAVTAATVGDVNFTSVGKFSVENPSFMHVKQWVDFMSTSDPYLFVTSFTGAPGAGHVSIVPGLKEAVKAGDVSTLKATKLDTGDVLKWPNDARMVPAMAFEANRVIAVPDGFMVPGKQNGGVYLVHVDSNDMTKFKFTEDYWYLQNDSR